MDVAGDQPASIVAFIVLAPFAAAIMAALVETVPVRLDDNLSVPVSAAAVLWVASLITGDGLADGRHHSRSLAARPAVNAAFAAAGCRTGAVSAAEPSPAG